MLLGLDFDNTIVSYDSLFHKVAVEGGWIPYDLPATKLSVRDRLREDGREETWIEMQGYVYGARMAEAAMYPGVAGFLTWARGAGVKVCIVSHKTMHPFRGPKYDLHAAARAWVANYLRDQLGPLVAPESVYFELTKGDKIRRIGELGCTVFVDDLPEIFESPSFPAQTAALLFDPDGHHPDSAIARVRSWEELRLQVQRQWHRMP